jgi:hypothetical protein
MIAQHRKALVECASRYAIAREIKPTAVPMTERKAETVVRLASPPGRLISRTSKGDRPKSVAKLLMFTSVIARAKAA